MKKRRYKIKEVPITWEDADTTELNIKKAVKGMFLSVLKIKFGRR